LGAEALSAALEGAAQFDNAQFWFSWRDEYWASKWREKIDALGDVVLLEIRDSYFGSGKDIRLYAVPSEYSEVAREQMSKELPRVRRAMRGGSSESSGPRIAITLNLSEAAKQCEGGRSTKFQITKAVAGLDR